MLRRVSHLGRPVALARSYCITRQIGIAVIRSRATPPAVRCYGASHTSVGSASRRESAADRRQDSRLQSRGLHGSLELIELPTHIGHGLSRQNRKFRSAEFLI